MKSSNSRTYNSIVNSFYGVLASVITVALNFVVRIVLVRQLGDEINGINSLFQSIINMMALLEMGISSAMIIHLYEPVKKEQQSVVAGIMHFYRQIYFYVAGTFALIGLLISFLFLDKLVTSSISTNTVRLYFLLFTLAFVLNYLTYYKRSLLFAEQKNRISIIVTSFCEICFRTFQIVSLIYLKDYYIFLLLLAIEKVVGNLICQRYVDKHHPYLVHNKVRAPKKTKKAIFATVKPLMVNQTATTIQNAASSILISLLLGNVSIVGYFGVYQLIISVVTLLFSQLGAAFTTSFGNLSVDKNYVQMKNVYHRSSFIFNWAACVCTVLVLACSDDFVFIFFGKNFVLSTANVLLLCFQMLITLLALPVVSIQNAMGLHRYDAKSMVIQALSAIFLGYVLGRIWGMAGILIGICIPMFCVLLIRKGIVIGRVVLSMTGKEFLSVLIPDFLYIIIISITTVWVCDLVNMEPSLGSLTIKFLIGIVISIFVTALIAKVVRRNEYIAVRTLVLDFLHKYK